MKVFKVIEKEIPNLSQQIKKARTDKEIGIAEICRRTEISKTHWVRIEKGKTALPIETLRKIEAAIGVEFDVELNS